MMTNALCENQGIRVLSLEQQTHDTFISSITNILEKNKTINVVSIKQSSAFAKSGDKLANALKKSSTLRSLSLDSNLQRVTK
mmetsp:Transcript_13272/g.14665  ORF Transcript_13272/g.14665 Transcript_13272/m.14665 type:complete len:82 (-) Transcript_13272:718-963(-)